MTTLFSSIKTVWAWMGCVCWVGLAKEEVGEEEWMEGREDGGRRKEGHSMRG